MGKTLWDKVNPFSDPVNIIDPGGLQRAVIDKIKGLGDDGMEYPAPDVDPETKALINKQAEDAKRSTDERASQILSGVDTGERFGLLQQDVAQQNASLGGNQAIDQAIQRRISKGFDRDTAQLKRDVNKYAFDKRIQDLDQAHSLNLNLQSIQANRVWRAKKEAANREAARNQLLGDILGFAGTVGGAVAGGIVGGPMGAMAGSAAGSQLASIAAPQSSTELSENYTENNYKKPNFGGAYGLG